MIYKILDNKSMSENDKIIFKNFLLSGGSIANDQIPKAINKISKIGFCYDENEIVGMGAIKNPLIMYRKKLSAHIGIEFDEVPKYELGYFYIKTNYRGKKIAQEIAKNLLKDIPYNIYATTQESNIPMQKILQQLGFLKTGNIFEGNNSNIFYFHRNFNF